MKAAKKNFIIKQQIKTSKLFPIYVFLFLNLPCIVRYQIKNNNFIRNRDKPFMLTQYSMDFYELD